ncbi:hypothetical protein GJ496_010057, partial [Pomphorhynchus laevis]
KAYSKLETTIKARSTELLPNNTRNIQCPTDPINNLVVQSTPKVNTYGSGFADTNLAQDSTPSNTEITRHNTKFSNTNESGKLITSKSPQLGTRERNDKNDII